MRNRTIMYWKTIQTTTFRFDFMKSAVFKKHTESVKKLTCELVEIAQDTHPVTFRTIFCAVLANVSAALPEEYWQGMMKSSECDIPGCDCHVGADAAMSALNFLRHEHAMIMKKRSVKN